jgi:stearoyl-CoA desaturase (delta-9 desaturase)
LAQEQTLPSSHPQPELPSRARRIDWQPSLPFFAFHLATFIGLFWAPVSFKWIALCLGLYALRMFGITAGYHRYFAHRTYKTSRVFQFLLAFLAQSSVQKGALWWAAHHRHHHKFSDQAQDIHSPVQDGFWWSHVGWILASDYAETRTDLIRDFTKFPELVFLNRYPHIASVTLAILLGVLGGFPALVWGMGLSTVLLWHGTFTINSLSHVLGTRRFETTDTSRNNPLLALITLGEGWHNNHHRYQSSTRQGFYWWELDITYLTLRLLAAMGLVWDLRSPPPQIYEEARARKAA